MKKNQLCLLIMGILFSVTAYAGSSDSTKENDPAAKRLFIEQTLNLANNKQQKWCYLQNMKAWVLSVVPAVAYPEIPTEEGVSVCVPASFVRGIDTNSDGKVDVNAENGTNGVQGSLVINYDAKVVSPNGQTYTAATAPVILNTGAAGYGSAVNQRASAEYAIDGYITVACGNRGKQDTVKEKNGETYYTGDAPCCLVDQKAAARFIKYNILLGNLPGNSNYFVSTGGSGGGAHAVMFSATSDNPDFYDYQIEIGAVGVYKMPDDSYSTEVTIKGKKYSLSDGAWGCIAYSPITPLYEADMDMAFEYYLNPKYSFNTPFQARLARYLSAAYAQYINDQKLSVKESSVGIDLNNDGDMDDTIPLTIEYNPVRYSETHGYYGTYLELYHAEFVKNLQWYINNLSYAAGWTWFDTNGKALTDKEVAAMTNADRVQAFIKGQYAKSFSPMGKGPGDKLPGGQGEPPRFTVSGEIGGLPPGDMAGGEMQGPPSGGMPPAGMKPDGMPPDGMRPGAPGPHPDQSSGSRIDSANYQTYSDMVAAYKNDITEIYEKDKYGKNIVSLYNPLHYINAEKTKKPAWTRIVMGAAEGDMSLFASLNMQLQWLKAGVDSEVEWQWDGHHVPSEILGNTFSLYVDQMYGKYVKGAVQIHKKEPVIQIQNGTASKETGTDISKWVNTKDMAAISFSLADAASYRTAGAMKPIPGFDVIDYGQEDYVFGNKQKDARHWDMQLLQIFEENSKELKPLFNITNNDTVKEKK